MFKRILWSLLVVIIVIILYFLVWPVPIDPVAWESPPNPGYIGSLVAPVLGRFKKEKIDL